MTRTMRRTCGAAPVQYEGKIGGYPFYFRARYDGWSIAITEPGDEPADDFTEKLYEANGSYGSSFDASSMPYEIAEAIVTEYLDRFAAQPGRLAVIATGSEEPTVIIS